MHARDAIDAAMLDRLLLLTEARLHRRGWDQPAQVLVLYDCYDRATEYAYREILASRRGGPTRCGPYAAQSAVPAEVLSGSASHALFRFALNLDHRLDDPGVSAIVDMMRQPGFLGMALASEAWFWAGTKEERKAVGNVRLADVPGSLECRNVWAVDIDGEVHFVQRVRGQKPQLLAFEQANITGAIIESLQLIVAVVAGLPKPKLTVVPSGWSWDDQRSADT